jgi:hypothetical protein
MTVRSLAHSVLNMKMYFIGIENNRKSSGGVGKKPGIERCPLDDE